MEERMYLLMAKKLSNEATPEELGELNAWLEASSDNRLAFDDVAALWNKTDILHQAQAVFDAETAWEKVASKTVAAQEIPLSNVRPMRKWWSVSAAAAAIIVIVLVYNFMGGSSMITQTADKQVLAVTLPDKSTVRLQPGSSLRYPENFESDERRIVLEGEAFFEVTRNAQKPFIVEAQSAQVQVLGTSFNVLCTDTTAAVAVATGKVSMSVRNEPERKIILLPGQNGVLESNTLRTEVDTNLVYYNTGRLIFADHSFEQAIAVVAKVKRVKIVFDHSIDNAKRLDKINITFKDNTLTEMLNELCMITGTRWRMENNRYVIYAK